MKDIRLIIAGDDSYRMDIYNQLDGFYGIVRIAEASSPARTISVIERNIDMVDCVLLGFRDEELESMMDVIIKLAPKLDIFVAIDNPLKYKKWQKYKAKVCFYGKEISRILEFYKKKEAKKYLDKDEIKKSQFEIKFLEEDERAKIVDERIGDKLIGFSEKKVVTFGSLSGGVGKTTIVSAIALSITSVTNTEVVVLDLDSSKPYGDAIRYLGITGMDKRKAIEIKRNEGRLLTSYPSERTVVGWVDFSFADKKFNKQIVKDCLVKIKNNLFVLPPAEVMKDYDVLFGESGIGLIKNIIDVLRRNFPIVLIDTGSLLLDFVKAAVEESDELYFISTIDKNALDCLIDYQYHSRNRLPGTYRMSNILNKVPVNFKDNIESSLPEYTGGVTVSACFREDQKLYEDITGKLKVHYVGSTNSQFTGELVKLIKIILRTDFGGSKTNDINLGQSQMHKGLFGKLRKG